MATSDTDQNTRPAGDTPRDPNMPISYAELIRGSVSMFLVGDGLEEMIVHTEAVAKQSPALHSLLHGSMEESRTKKIKWPDVDKGTFDRFAQFIYTGDFPPPPSFHLRNKTPEPVAVEAQKPRIAEPTPQMAEYSAFQEDEALPVEEPYDGYREDYDDGYSEQYVKTDSWGYSGKKKKKSQPVAEKKKEFEKNEFEKLKYAALSPTKLSEMCCIPSQSDGNEVYAPVFLGHAQLYVLADRWFMEPLKNLVLEKLHATLSKFVPYEARYGDIAELVRYTYKNTPCRESGMDELRELVTKYVTYQVPQMLSSECGKDLLEEIGPFARDITPMIIKRARF